nr:rRNA maturation RNase YbeY [bacterium]
MMLEWQWEGIERQEALENIMSKAMDSVIKALQLDGRMSAFIWMMDDAKIRQINLLHRNIDSATDVLSFPAIGLKAPVSRGEDMRRHKSAIDAETGCVMLGDILISLPRAREQAQEYGHSLEREAAFLCVHGLLHLLGYDHLTAEQAAPMRAMEETALSMIGLSR